MTVDFPPDVELGLPLQIVDATGKTYTIHYTHDRGVMTRNDTGSQRNELRSIVPGRYSSEGRRSTYKFFVQLLGGK